MRIEDAISELKEKRNCTSGNKPCGAICVNNSKKCRIEGGEPEPVVPITRKSVEKALDGKSKDAKNSTFQANVNELAFARDMVGGFDKVNGFSQDPEGVFTSSGEKAGEPFAEDRNRMGSEMASLTKEWLAENGFTSPIAKVHWTARPGTLGEAIGDPTIDQKKHPADLVLEFEDGTFLGVSAKSSRKSRDKITFKGSGSGTLAKKLNNPNIASRVADLSDKFARENGIPDKGREKIIRSNPKLREKASKEGQKVIEAGRDELLSTFEGMGNAKSAKFIKDNFLDLDEQGLRYIRVTGRNNGNNKITDPRNYDLVNSLDRGDFKFEAGGTGTINLVDNLTKKKIMVIRAKFGGLPMAGRALKFDVR